MAPSSLLAVVVLGFLTFSFLIEAQEVQEVDLPAVTFRDLQQRSSPSFGRSLARHALAELGALELTDVPGFAAARRAALEGAARCLADSGLERTLPDGAVRRSLAAQTSASGLLGPLDEEGRAAGSAACAGAWRAEADHLRLLVRAAALLVATVIGDQSQAASQALSSAVSLEHFHLYRPASEAPVANGSLASGSLSAEVEETVPLHVDAGLLIAATVGLSVDADGASAQVQSGPLLLQRADGELVRPRLRQDSLLLLVGSALATVAPKDARAAPHALRLHGSFGRAWFGSMLLPPELLATSASDGPEAAAAAVQSLGCRGAAAPAFGSAVDLAGDCGEGKSWCWMRCMPVPVVCASDPASLTCMDAKTGMPWQGGHSMCSSCIVTCPAEEKAERGRSRFCLSPGADMYMTGFHFVGDPDDNCLVYLMPSLVLDTPIKFWTAVVTTFFLCFFGPEILRRWLATASREKPEGKLHRIAQVVQVRTLNLLCVMHAYLIMLLSMTFSIEIFMSIVLGLALGRSHLSGEQRVQTLCCLVNDAVSPVKQDSPVIGRVGFAVSEGKDDVAASAQGQLELSIGGMTCTSCSGAVERCLRTLDGVSSAEVFLLQERATVLFDPGALTPAQICEAVDVIGFDASVLRKSVLKPGTSSASGELEEPPALLHLEGLAESEALRAAGGNGFVDVQLVPTGPNTPGLLRISYNPRQVGARVLLARLVDAGCDLRMPAVPPPLSILADGARAEQHELQIGLAFQSAIAPAIVALLVLAVVMSPSDMGLEVHNQAAAHWFGTGMLVVIAIVASWATFRSRAGRYFLDSASKALQHDSFTMDVLVAASTCVTSVYGLGLTVLCFTNADSPVLTELRGSAAHFLAMAPVLLLVVLGGKKLEFRARQRTAAALKELLAAQPTTAMVRLPENGGSFQEMPLELLELGDRCRVSVGSRFPAEGVVVEGGGAADESLVTGESAPVEKLAGAPPGSSAACCLAGSTLASGDIIMSVTAVGPATTLGRLAELVSRAQGSKPSVQRLADDLASRFVPCVLLLSLATAAVWLFLLFAGDIEDAPQDPALKICLALQFGLAVMMLACPCAMGLATPTAISVAVGVASSRHHCLVRDASVLERGASRGKKTFIVLDKTGTVTEGKPRAIAAALWADPEVEWAEALNLPRVDAVAGAIAPEWLSGEAHQQAAALWLALGCAESAAPVHPIAVAVDRFCQQHAPGLRSRAEVLPGHLEHLPGRGFRAEVRLGSTSVHLHVGGPSMLSELEEAHPNVDWPRLRAWANRQGGASIVFAVAAGGAAAAVVALRDPIRPEAKRATEALVRAYGGRGQCEIWLCTGDNAAAAAVAAGALGVPMDRVRSGQLPQDKRALVETLQGAGAEVVMVGDGLNDAPALAQADLGVAIGAGAQLACDAADVVLCRSSLLDLLAFRELCLATRIAIYRNFVWAFGFNIIGLPLAAGCGYPWGISISPMLAGMAMSCSSVLVVTSSLMLNRFRPSAAADDMPASVAGAASATGGGLEEPLLGGSQGP
mmetsp:Transcript_147226/g.470577  ORF Transcript_147226/g.470577 Transcript_147226/m.470577 type:complete len:1524 (-) Transcript_147226:187-4758(-)